MNCPLSTSKAVLAQPSRVTRCPHRVRSAFSLIELMITVGLLTFIVLGLLAMFNQTQRAFRASMTQTDVLEAGRAVTDMVARELEQMIPSQMSNTVNFLTELAPPPRLDGAFAPTFSFQDLPGTTDQRVNVFGHFFFLTQENQRWTGVGYLVGNPNSGAGTLYRFEAETNSVYYPAAVASLVAQFDNTARWLYKYNVATNGLRRIADGVVHLRTTAYGTNGNLLVATNLVRNALIRTNAVDLRSLEYYFLSNAVPATVELEIGFLEDKPLARLRSIPDASVQKDYLQKHVGQVHVFRQRIPIRNADFSAYQ